MTRPGRPRRRPPWWPENEQWPPTDADGRRGWGHGPPHGWGGGPRRPFGCILIVVVLLAAGLLTAAVWSLAALVGLVSAPSIVVLGGLVATGVVFVATAAALSGVRRMSAPIDDLSDAAERIERGDYSMRVEERGTRQVRSLVHAFNQMSARLADVDTGRRTFLADVAHELRTPLSVIEGQLEAIEDGVYPADTEHLAPIHEQIRTLERLIDDMRTVALADAGSLVLERKPTDLSQLVDESVASFAARAQAAGVELSSDPIGDLHVSADPARIRQVLANLLANALRHTPSGGWVRVSAGFVGEPPTSVAVTVADNGTGIPTDLLATVFDRFVKDPASPGSGLGLAIARELVEAHGGTISVESRPGAGSTFRFVLPH